MPSEENISERKRTRAECETVVERLWWNDDEHFQWAVIIAAAAAAIIANKKENQMEMD